MNTAGIFKRIFIYLFDLALSFAFGLILLCFIPVLSLLNDFIYIILSIILGFILYFLYVFIVLYLTNGYTLFSFFFSCKIVVASEKKIAISKCIIRALFECLIIFPFIDLIFLIVHRSGRGVIDRVSDTYMISTNYY